MDDARRLVRSTDSVLADLRLVAAELKLGRPLVKDTVLTVLARGAGRAGREP